VVTDVLSDYLFAPSEDAVQNLRMEGIPPERIHLVGNIMIDSLQAHLDRARASHILKDLGLKPNSYFVATLHRPSNVDDPGTLERVVEILAEVARLRPEVLVAHPRTTCRLAATDGLQRLAESGVRVIEPLGYLDFLRLLADATAVLTDSGGIQEETTVLGVPCITLRDRTERPITVSLGTNLVAGLDAEAVLSAARAAITDRIRPARPPLWDGHTADRIVDILVEHLDRS
jgi:UDP-N-acetylglucosamine 2-epimerase (non-hydrolysing)